MSEPALTGAQKSKLRSLGQTLEPALKLGRDGVTPAFLAEFEKALGTHELIKVRFVGADRHEREELLAAILAGARSLHIGSVGATALFYRPNPEPARRKITFG